MRRSEIREAGAIAGDLLAGSAQLIGETHRVVSDRVFASLGVLGAPVRVIHDAAVSGAYGAVRGAMRAVPRSGSAALSATASADASRLAESSLGTWILGGVNGAVGDYLADRSSPLEIEMAIREQGADVPPTPHDLDAAFPSAGSRMAVFVHGLFGNDENWELLPIQRGPARRPSYGSRLRADLGFTPVHVRYNTGRRVSDNGRALSQLLEETVASWPVPVEELVLFGHSMGGLVARSACHAGEEDDAAWTRVVRHVICLGSPHIGSPVEKGAHLLSWALRVAPYTRPFARAVNTRSVGIKDMRFGTTVEADWSGHDVDEFMHDRCTEIPFLPNATYCFVAASLGPPPFDTILGDLLVRVPSASGESRKRRIGFEASNGMRLSRTDHIGLLNHPAVYDQIVKWLGRQPRELPAPA